MAGVKFGYGLLAVLICRRHVLSWHWEGCDRELSDLLVRLPRFVEDDESRGNELLA